MAYPLATERVWIEKAKYHDAEKDYFEHLSKLLKGSNNNNNNNKIELQKQQDHEEEQKDQIMQSTKSKKVKKDKNKKIKLQQSSTEELSSSQNNELSSKNENENSVSVVSAAAAVKEQQQCIENSSSSNITGASAAAAVAVATNMNSNNINTTDDDSKQKKKKKKKNKSTEHKLNENLNNDGKSQLNDNGTGTAVSSNSNVVNNTESLNQDEITDPNNKKNEIKQRPTNLKNSKGSSVGTNQNTLVSEIAKARQHIKNSLEKMDGIAALAASPGTSPGSDVLERFITLEKENATFKGLIEQLRKSQIECEKRINSLETKLESLTLSVQQQLQSKKPIIDCVATTSKSTTKKVDDDDDDGVDLFESDSEEEDAEAAKVREQRLAEYAAKKSKKPTLIAKSNVILDVKPWDDETDLGQMEKEIRKITTDGLLWGSSKLVPVAFGIKKLTISCVVEDEKVSIDWLTEEIEKLEDYVQSVDVAAFNKI